MPIPEPKKDESVSKFVGRCMSDKVMLKEYPESGERAGVCYSAYRKAKKKK